MNIDRTAKALEQAYTQRLLKDDKLAHIVLDNVPGNMTTAKAVEIGRAVLRGDRDYVFQMMLEMVGAAIKDQAEMDAEQEVMEQERREKYDSMFFRVQAH